VELEQSKYQVRWDHRDMQNELNVSPVMQVRGFNMKKNRGMAKNLLILMSLSFVSGGIEDLAQLGTVEKIYREMSKVSGLQGSSKFLDVKMKLELAMVKSEIVNPSSRRSLHLQVDLAEDGF
jgi:hypothetical protein